MTAVCTHLISRQGVASGRLTKRPLIPGATGMAGAMAVAVMATETAMGMVMAVVVMATETAMAVVDAATAS